jgi:hypothetical protein
MEWNSRRYFWLGNENLRAYLNFAAAALRPPQRYQTQRQQNER